VSKEIRYILHIPNFRRHQWVSRVARWAFNFVGLLTMIFVLVSFPWPEIPLSLLGRLPQENVHQLWPWWWLFALFAGLASCIFTSSLVMGLLLLPFPATRKLRKEHPELFRRPPKGSRFSLYSLLIGGGGLLLWIALFALAANSYVAIEDKGITYHSPFGDEAAYAWGDVEHVVLSCGKDRTRGAVENSVVLVFRDGFELQVYATYTTSGVRLSREEAAQLIQAIGLPLTVRYCPPGEESLASLPARSLSPGVAKNIEQARDLWTSGNTPDINQRIIAAAEQALALSDTDGERAAAHYWVGIGYYRLGNFALAQEHEEQSITLDPTFVGPYVTLGAVMLQYGGYKQAEAFAERAIALDPEYHWAYNLKGLALEEQGRYGEAIPYFERAIELSPHNPVFQENLERVAEEAQEG